VDGDLEKGHSVGPGGELLGILHMWLANLKYHRRDDIQC
jgi:hypothetical protein